MRHARAAATAAHRARFLAALRSGAYPKGPTVTDTRGRPLDPDAPGWCVDGLAYTLFHAAVRPGSLVPVRAALGVSRATFRWWQETLNDSPRTFAQIADVIEAAWRREKDDL